MDTHTDTYMQGMFFHIYNGVEKQLMYYWWTTAQGANDWKQHLFPVSIEEFISIWTCNMASWLMTQIIYNVTMTLVSRVAKIIIQSTQCHIVFIWE